MKARKARIPKGIPLDQLIETFHVRGKGRQYYHYENRVPEEQRARLSSLQPLLESLHVRLGMAGSAALVELAYEWTEQHHGTPYREETLGEARHALEFLIKEHPFTILDYIALRHPWRRHGGRELKPWRLREQALPEYGRFMLDTLIDAEKISEGDRRMYLGLVKELLESELESAVIVASGLPRAFTEFGSEAVTRYFLAGFGWLAGKQEADGKVHGWLLGREIRSAVWHFLSRHHGSEDGLKNMESYLGKLDAFAVWMEKSASIYGRIAQELLQGCIDPEQRLEVWSIFKDLPHAVDRFERVGYDYMMVVSGVTDEVLGLRREVLSNEVKTIRARNSEVDALRFARALRDNYARTVAVALERAGGKRAGPAAELLDGRNAGTIAEHIYDEPFWERLAGIVAQMPVVSPSGWVPDTEEAVTSFLESLKGGEYFAAEKQLLVQNGAQIAKTAGIDSKVSVVDLGIGNGEKIAALLNAASSAPATVNLCAVDSNSLIAMEGLEGLMKGIDAHWGHAGHDYSFGSMWVKGSGIFVLEGRLEKVGAEMVEVPVNAGFVIENFERLAVNPYFKRFAEQNSHYLTTMLGTTFGNFEPSEAGRILHEVAGNWALVGVNLYGGNDEALIAAYDTPGNLAMAHRSLLGQGVKHEDLERFGHHVEVRKRAETLGEAQLGVLTRLLTYVQVKPGSPVKGGLQEFKPGDIVNVGLSIKYTDGQMRKVLGHSGFAVEQAWANDSAGLYLARKVA